MRQLSESIFHGEIRQIHGIMEKIRFQVEQSLNLPVEELVEGTDTVMRAPHTWFNYVKAFSNSLRRETTRRREKSDEEQRKENISV